MRKACFTEHQIISVIKSAGTVKDVWRDTGVSEATNYISGTDSGFGLLLTSIRHQENLCPNGLSAHNHFNN
ncbi:TPA: hypothetical protein QHT32_004339 [Escherichia coli]|nr:hypothetical protein [Escherichia coli]